MSKSQDKRLAVQRGVVRYDWKAKGMKVRKTGDWVPATDYDTLEAENHRLDMDAETFKQRMDVQDCEIAELKAENKRLRETLSEVTDNNVLAQCYVRAKAASEAENKRLKDELRIVTAERDEVFAHQARIERIAQMDITALTPPDTKQEDNDG